MQGVGFRWATQQEASRLGLGGWVRNLPDGRVEVSAEGAEAPLEALLRWCGRGPDDAIVDSVEIVERGETSGAAAPRFEIRK